MSRLFIIDASRALLKAIRASFGRNTPIQRCQIHKASNITERLPKSLHASVRRTLRQAWELDDADNAEKLDGSINPVALADCFALSGVGECRDAFWVKGENGAGGVVPRRPLQADLGAAFCSMSSRLML